MIVRSDEGVTIETSAFQLVTVTKLHFQLAKLAFNLHFQLG